MTKELLEVLNALCSMWSQYCGGNLGHMFMSAGEETLDVLERYDLIKNHTGDGGDIDWDKLTELEKSVKE